MTTTGSTPRPEQADAWLRALLDAAALEPFCEILTITPDMARVLMTRNLDNRRLSRSIVGQLAEDLKGGRWQFNGESIVIARSGELNDGQHRLQAVIESGIGAQMVLVGGADRESRMTLDMGRNRGVHDYLHFKGVRNPITVASAARLVIGFEASGGKNFERVRDVSKVKAMARGETDKRLQDAGVWAQTGPGHLIHHMCPPAPLATCYYLIRQLHPDRGERFMQAIADGANLPRGSAILTARRYLPTFAPRHREGKMALIFRAWNAWVRGEDGTPDSIHGRYPLPPLIKPEK